MRVSRMAMLVGLDCNKEKEEETKEMNESAHGGVETPETNKTIIV